MTNEISTQKADDLTLIRELIDNRAIPSTIENTMQGAAIVKYGREIGMQPMVALTNVDLVKGRPYVSTDYLAAQFKRKGFDYRIIKMTDEENVLKAMDQYGTWFDFEFTMEDARQQGLLKVKRGKDGTNYNQYELRPKLMLFKRNLRQAISVIAPELEFGIEVDQKIVSKEPVTPDVHISMPSATSTVPNIDQETISKIQEETGITINSLTKPLLDKHKVENISEVPAKDVDEYLESIKEDIDDTKRLNSLDEEAFFKEVYPKINDLTSNSEIDEFLLKYSKFEHFTPMLRIEVTKRRNEINKS